ncbi:hypothetical protein HK100_007247 [Physocladia obscura]|uniref:Uncharacterized protein n=1 Tax=Physocladia obscura TaxID=109957 RepID=A0AAD5SV83_9FUNG|nr:hypothetical protein HK100_007247 [Physocladia obscura]
MNLRPEEEEVPTHRQPRLNFRDSVETLVDFDENAVEEFLSAYSAASLNTKNLSSDTKPLNAAFKANKISARTSSSSLGMPSNKRAVMPVQDLCDSLKSKLDNAPTGYGLDSLIAPPLEGTDASSDSVASDSDEPEWCSVRRWGSDSWSVASSSCRSSLSLDAEQQPSAEIVAPQSQSKSLAKITLSHLPIDRAHLSNRFFVQKRATNNSTNNNKTQNHNHHHNTSSFISNNSSSPNNQKASLHSHSNSSPKIKQIADVVHLHHSRAALLIQPVAIVQQQPVNTSTATTTQNQQDSVNLKAAGTAAKSVFSSLIGLTKRASGILGTAAVDAYESFSGSQTVATRTKTLLSEAPLTAQEGEEAPQNDNVKEQQQQASASPQQQKPQKEVSFDPSSSTSSPHLIKSLFKPTQRIIYFIGKASTQKPHSLLARENLSPQLVAPLKSVTAEPLESIYDVLQGNVFERALDEIAVLAEEEEQARTLLRAKHLGLVFPDGANSADGGCAKKGDVVFEEVEQTQNMRRSSSISSIATLLIDGQVELSTSPLVFGKAERMEIEQGTFEIV